MDRALTVTQVGTYIKQIFDAEEMLSYIRVIGEISGLSISKGVAYFVLKDENAQLQCVCFSPEKFNFNNGDKVYATGTPKYYVKGGKLNFNVSKIEQAGLGELYVNFLMLKQKLELLGYFDVVNKKAIPKNIKRIGVVTSAEGAVIQDIINVRNRRNKNVDIVLYPVKVQGVGAEYEIKKGIEFFDNYDVDVVVVARGGGSLEDLMPFNTEVVANAVFYSNKPIVSAVGHETDFTICDFVADLRAPTPSVASELLCEDIQTKKQNVLSLLKRLNLAVIKNFRDGVSQSKIVINNFINNINLNINNLKMSTKNLCIKLSVAQQKVVESKQNRLDILLNKLNKLNPEEILKLGYATIKKQDNYIMSVDKVEIGQNIDILLKDGLLSAVVNNKEKK